jgi:type I restriction-modification system DNA methylase subunit
MPEFDIALEKIGVLVRDFQSHESHYKSAGYQEAEARKDFIDKFWIVLGWDVNHEKQTNPYEQEVKVERGVAVGGNQRRADYAFYLRPNYHDVRFLVEAKKPSGEFATKENYFQLIRYAWNSNTPLAVLTDFEELHILDCRYRPDLATALNHTYKKFHYTDYTNREKFAEIYWLFSREAVADGSIEKRAKELPKPRGKAIQRGLFPGGYQSIDESFLKELDEYRTSLARTFKNKNPELDSEILTELAQRTLDRLVFLRFLEDKGIEPKRLVELFGDKGTAWQDFIATSRRLDGIYNGIVYKRHAILDGPKFRVDDTAFANICEDLARINSPYDFNAIPIHILGSIYERFLGKVIVATDKRAKVEEKPEVRKAGGVYYTPEYIVRYIVDNTVGKLIAGKTPKEIAEMRFADIACGSGSFLLGVFDVLLSYHGNYYNSNPEEVHKGDCIKRDGRLYLSLGKKREILLNNIYGVDIDSQAVEVCQLSLYLKLLQEETEASTHQYILDFEHIAKMKKLLPDLSKNIICGNSLIGSDILDGQLFAGDEERKLNPLNFEDTFPEVIKRGGFDAVIGNPPYIRIQTLQEINSDQVIYFKRTYRTAASGNYDIYVVFVEKGLDLLSAHGRLGFILPHKFFNSQYGSSLRGLIGEGKHLSHIVHFGEQQVFHGATTYTALMFLDKSGNKSFEITRVNDLQAWSMGEPQTSGELEAVTATAAEWHFVVGHHAALFERLSRMPVKLGDIAHTFVGTQTSADDIFVLENCHRSGKYVIGESKSLGKEVKVERNGVVAFLRGKDIRRYKPLESNARMICPYEIAADGSYLLSKEAMQRKYPYAFDYLRINRDSLSSREKGRFKGENWYAYGYPKSMTLFQRPKIVVPDYNNEASFTLDDDGHFFKTGYGIIIKELHWSPLYVLGLLNSKLLFTHLVSISTSLRGKYVRFWTQYIEQLPIRIIDFTVPVAKKRHNDLISKVEAMLEAKKQLAKAQTDKDKAYYENKCATLDRQIDRLVYDLYGLTEAEIKLVEESTR